MKWELKKNIPKIEVCQYGDPDFWWLLLDLQSIKIESILNNKNQIEQVKKSIKLLQNFKDTLESRKIIIEK